MGGAEVQIRGAKATISITSPVTTFNTLQIIDYPTLVSLGLISGHTHDSKVGVNTAIPSSTFILLSNVTSSTFPINFPSSPIQMQLVSTSVSDTAAGIGAQQIKLTYLRSPSSPQGFTINSEFISLNGTTPVNTTNTDIFRVEKLEVSRTGTGLFAVGDISLQNIGGTTTFERIDAGTNINRTAIHFVQKGFRSTLFEIEKGASTAGGIIFIVEMTFEYPGLNAVTHGIAQIEMANNAIIDNLAIPHTIANPNGLILFFAIVVRGRASNQSGAGTIHFIDSPL